MGMGPDAMILVFWMFSFKPAFSVFSFTFIKRLLSSSLLSAIMVVSALPQLKSAIGILMSPPSQTSHPIPPLCVVTEHRLSSLSPTANAQWLSILLIHIVIYMSQCYSLNSLHLILPFLCPQVYSLCLYLYCYYANRFISTVFLGFTGNASGKEPIYLCRKHKTHRSDPWEDTLNSNPLQYSCLENPTDRGVLEGYSL